MLRCGILLFAIFVLIFTSWGAGIIGFLNLSVVSHESFKIAHWPKVSRIRKRITSSSTSMAPGPSLWIRGRGICQQRLRKLIVVVRNCLANTKKLVSGNDYPHHGFLKYSVISILLDKVSRKSTLEGAIACCMYDLVIFRTKSKYCCPIFCMWNITNQLLLTNYWISNKMPGGHIEYNCKLQM